MIPKNNNLSMPSYGSWQSPLSSTMLTDTSISLDELSTTGSNTYWIEKRPNEAGRCVIVHYNGETSRDLLSPPYSARSRVHEYGGGAYCCVDNTVYFVNDADQDIYCIKHDSQPVRITNTPALSYADLIFDAISCCIICICEDNSSLESEATNTIVSISVETGTTETLCSGMDFYSNPRLSQCGSMLSFLCWNHPDMPWDNTQLCITDYNKGKTSGFTRNVCSLPDTSCFQPEWSPDNQLYYISDQTGWWNIYRYDLTNSYQVTSKDYEFGLPQWVFNQSTYAFIDTDTLVCTYIKQGISCLALLDIKKQELTDLNTAYSAIESLRYTQGHCWFIGASSTEFPAVVKINLATLLATSIKSSCSTNIPATYFSTGQPLDFTSRHGDIVHAIYYPPCNPDYVQPDNRQAPLIVLAHGGPTAMANTSLDLRKQYWTSRGFGILDVNYSGSTGYGRAYRQRLNYQWGIRDAEDCCDAATYMIEQGLAKPDQLIIKGSSAGGYTVLCALTFHNVFSAGASYYGIGDLTSLLQDTHKFESRYLDRLIADPNEQTERYTERSPIRHTHLLNCPVIILQGKEDKVVPRDQAKNMYQSLLNKGIPVALLEFEGEQHGFRKAETIRTAIDSELAFYSAILGIKAYNCIDMHIDNFSTD